MANKNRVQLNRLVKPSTVAIVKTLAESLELSEGRVLDRAVELLASGESFGLEHVKLPELAISPDIAALAAPEIRDAGKGKRTMQLIAARAGREPIPKPKDR